MTSLNKYSNLLWRSRDSNCWLIFFFLHGTMNINYWAYCAIPNEAIIIIIITNIISIAVGIPPVFCFHLWSAKWSICYSSRIFVKAVRDLGLIAWPRKSGTSDFHSFSFRFPWLCVSILRCNEISIVAAALVCYNEYLLCLLCLYQSLCSSKLETILCSNNYHCLVDFALQHLWFCT